MQTTWRTSIFTVISVPLELVLGLAFALLLNEEFRGRTIFRSVMIVPYAMLTISNGLVWDYILDPTYGTLNVILQRWGLIQRLPELAGHSERGDGLGDRRRRLEDHAVHDDHPAGLAADLPRNMYRAAEVDGAGVLKRFWTITLPMLRPAILVALVLRTLGAFRVYDIIYVLTGGGPADATNVLSYYIYQQAFIDFHIGYASAVAYLTTWRW